MRTHSVFVMLRQAFQNIKFVGSRREKVYFDLAVISKPPPPIQPL